MKVFIKKFGIALAAALGGIIALLAVLLGKRRESTPAPPPPPTPPVIDAIPIPVVDEKPADTYAESKTEPATDPSAVVVSINERHK